MKKMLLFFLFTWFFSGFGLYAGDLSHSNRFLSIYVDQSEIHNGFVTYQFLTNMAAESNPILVTKHLFAQFLAHKHNFKNSDDKAYQLFRSLVDVCNGTLKDTVSFDVVKELYAKKIDELLDLPNQRYLLHDWRFVAQAYAYSTQFSLERWDVYAYGDFFYLLVPKSYKKQCKDVYCSNNVVSDAYSLGLKIDTLVSVTQKDLTALAQYVRDDSANTYASALYQDLIDEQKLAQLFVTKKEYSSVGITKQPAWKLLVVGHGSAPLREEFCKYAVMRKTGNYNLKDFTNAFLGNIPLYKWKKFLKFCHEYLPVKAFFFHGCNMGGVNAECLVRAEDGQYEPFCFPIIFPTIFEAFIRSPEKSCYIPKVLDDLCYSDTVNALQFGNKKNCIHKVVNSVDLVDRLALTECFKEYHDLWSSFLEHTYNEYNTAFCSVKYPGVASFCILRPYATHYTVSQLVVHAHNGMHPVIVPENIETVALSTEHIPCLQLQHKHPNSLTIVPHISGDAVCVIDELRAPYMSSNYVPELLMKFWCVNELRSVKSILIKKMLMRDGVCKNSLVTLNEEQGFIREGVIQYFYKYDYPLLGEEPYMVASKL